MSPLARVLVSKVMLGQTGIHLLIYSQLLERHGPIADWANPLWPLLLQLKVGRGIEALHVSATKPPDGQLEVHIRKGAF